MRKPDLNFSQILGHFKIVSQFAKENPHFAIFNLIYLKLINVRQLLQSATPPH
jgi:hypothetical protein